MQNSSGFFFQLPHNCIPIAQLPTALREAKQAWLSCVSVAAVFSSDVDDGDLVRPMSESAEALPDNVAEWKDAIWVPVKRLLNAEDDTFDSTIPAFWGIAFKQAGRVLFGPTVQHSSFGWRTGDVLYADKRGKLTTTNTGVLVGFCVAPSTIYIGSSASDAEISIQAMQEKLTTLDNFTQGLETRITAFDQRAEDLAVRDEELEEQIENVATDASSEVATLDRTLREFIAEETTPIATGSITPRTLADRFADVVNVKDFGAVGDGVADDTTALNLAMTAATGKVLYIPAGTYLTSTGLRIPAHTCVRGDGPWSTIIKLTSDLWETPCITNASNTTPEENSGAGDYGIRLENICADGNGYRDNGSGSANHNGSAISWKNVHDLVQTNTRAIRGRLHCLDIASATYNNYYDADTADFTVGASTDVRVENFWGEDACTDDCLTTHYSGRLKFINCHLTGTKDRPYEKTFNQCGVEIDDGSFDVEMRGAYVTGFSWGIASKAHNERDPSGVVKPALPARNIHFYDCVAEGNVVNWRVVNLGTAHNVGTTSIHNCKSITPITPAENGSGTDASTIPTHLYFSGRTDGLKVNGFVCQGIPYRPADRGILLYPVGIQAQDAEAVELRDIHFEDVALTSSAYGLIAILGAWLKPAEISDISCKECGDKPLIYVSGVTMHNIARVRGYSSTTKTCAVVRLNSTAAVTSGSGFITDVSHSGYLGAVQVGSQYIDTISANKVFASPASNDIMLLYQTPFSDAVSTPLARYIFSLQTGGSLGNGYGAGIAFARDDIKGLRDDAIIGAQSVVTAADATSHLTFATRAEGEVSPIPRWMIHAGATTSVAVHSFHPCVDNAYMVGHPNYRPSSVYAASGSIITSDARCKQNAMPPEDAIMRAWGKVDFKAFQFTDAVEKKGDAARIHFGVIAQQVADAFASEGLDARRYALFCYDKWDDEYAEVEIVDVEAVLDEEGNEVTPAVTHMEQRLVTPAGDRYGIRYEEALALECAYQRWRLSKLEEKIDSIS